MVKRSWHRGLIPLLAIPVLAACSVRPPSAPESAGGMHAIHDEHMRVILRRLDELMYEQTYTQITLDERRRADLEQLAAHAARLVGSAETINEVLEWLDLDATEEQRFYNFADQFNLQAQALNRVAASGRDDLFRPALDELHRVCQDCHASFRDPYLHRLRR